MKIAAVVVTHNRLPLLKDCISGIRSQEKPVDKILVVNNGSTDGTERWLKDQPDLEIINQQNLGSAGGFATGIKQAYEAGFEWIWIMDDDVIPLRAAVSNFEKLRGSYGFLNSLKIGPDNKVIPWNRTFDPTSCFCFAKTGEPKIVNGVYETNVGCFEGAFIHRHVIQKIGLPRKDFFINGDDTLYGYLASLHTNIVCIAEPLLFKPIVKKYEHSSTTGYLDTSPINTYYFIRNKFLCRRLLKSQQKVSNLCFTKAVFKFYTKMLCKSLGSFRFDYFASLNLGVYHGLISRFGKK